jgi:alkylhydroperoxidase family enzyme
VQRGGKNVQTADVDAAREAGATDVEIHDTVLIAAAFCMFNRYVDGLATTLPDDPAGYAGMAEVIVSHGYAAALG